MSKKSSLIFVAVLFNLLPAAAVTPAEPAADAWIQLFNGKDLRDWKIKITGYELHENFGNTFRVEEGKLKVSYDEYTEFKGRFGHIFYKTPFSHYVLRAEYRFVGDQANGGPGWAVRNSGLMLHGQSPESMGKDQEFPVSIELQLLGGTGSGRRPTGNLCTPGTHVVMDGELVRRHCTRSSSETYDGDQWVTVEVEVRGNQTIRHRIEGETVLEDEKPQLDETDSNAQKLIKDGNTMIDAGYISLQGESHGVEFRKIELRPLREN